MTSTWALHDAFLPANAIKLGRLVRSTKDPQHTYNDPAPGEFPQILRKEQTNFREIISNFDKKWLEAMFSKFVKGRGMKESDALALVTASQGVTYQLSNSESWFCQAFQDPETCKFVEQALRTGHPVYLVVGFHTLNDPTIFLGTNVAKALAGGIQLPLSEGLTAAGVILPPPLDNLDPKIDGGWQAGVGQSTSFTAKGELIYAVQYQRLNVKRFSSKAVGRMRLDKAVQWKRYIVLMGGPEEEDEVEASLEEGLGRADTEVEEDNEFLVNLPKDKEELRDGSGTEAEEYKELLVKSGNDEELFYL